ncbi:2752_t:CDS:2 [Acaulospora morrowiae]|uniref:2752_t:CDS:1 n=1 Tax=Acaulospora morrowiae TaxID=94023 RepID=A0A9N9BXC8_9GLOM|nr:2752_t:CDS:2 [Acaulospora morrowiae]
MAATATSPTNATTQTPAASRGPSAGQKVNASEVGWLFVHEYYTFLNKEPSRLHCFYGRKSTLIHGTEGEPVKPIQGEKEIQEKIQELDLENCRVRVTNVDSQSSINGGIVIQVLGEMSNRSESSRKFAQTFFLAEQPNGYYVMNDIIRFLKEDDEVDEEGEEIETETHPSVEGAVTNDANEEEIGSTSPTGTLVEEPINGRAVPEAVGEVTITITSRQTVVSTEETINVSVNGTEVHDEVQATANEEPIEPSSSTLTVTSQSVLTSSDNVTNVDQPRSIPVSHSAKQSTITPQTASPKPVANISGQTQSTPTNAPNPLSHNNSSSLKPTPNSQFPSPKPTNNDTPQNLPKQPSVQTPKPSINNSATNIQAPTKSVQNLNANSISNDFQSPSVKNNTNNSQSSVTTNPASNSQSVTVTVTNSLINGQQANTKQPAPTTAHTQPSRSSHNGQTYAQRSAPNQTPRSVAPVGNKQIISQRATSPAGRSISPIGNGQITPDPQRSISPIGGSASENVHPTTSVQQTDSSGEDSVAKSVVVNGQPATNEAGAQGDVQKNGQVTAITSNQNSQAEITTAQPSDSVQQVNTQQQQQKSQDPPAVKTWASLAADDHSKWNNALAEKKGHVAPVQAPVPKTTPQQQRQHTRDNQDRRQDGTRGNNRRNSDIDNNLSIYVKGVTSTMTREQLQSAFKTFGVVSHIDVVPTKSCAFVEYNNPAAYRAALNAKSVNVGNEIVYTEERRGNNRRNNKTSRGEELRYKNLSRTISQQIFTITSNMTSIRNLVGYLGTAKDTPDVRTKLHNLTEKTRDLVKETSNNIKSLSHYESTSAKNRHRKVEQEKLSKDFQKTIQEFQKVQRLSAEKQREYVDKAKTLNVRNDVYDDDPGISEEQPLIDDSNRRLQLQILDNEIEYNESLIAEREVEIREIEQGINELNEIFRDLGTLVTEHQTMLDNIESNVTNIAVNVRNAADELTIASRYQRNARNRMCCLMLIFAVVGGVVVLAALA